MKRPVMHSIWLLLILSVLSSGVSAGTLGDLTYEIADGEVRITNCETSAEGELVIPIEIEGLPVTSIGRFAFRECRGLTSITIPDSVTRIGEWAFSWCSSLISMDLPKNVTSIGWNAFYCCTSLVSINIPDGLTSIESAAFNGCESLTSVIIPDGVTSIGYMAFFDCSSLTSIIIPNSVTSIEDEALWNCFALESVVVPASFHSRSEAIRIGGSATGDLWFAGRYTKHQGVASPSLGPAQASIRMVPAITVTGDVGRTSIIEVADTADGPWAEWRTVVIGEEGTTEVDLNEGAEKRFYRVRD